MRDIRKLGPGWGRWWRLEPEYDDYGNEHGFCDFCSAGIGWQDDGDRYVNGWWRQNPITGDVVFACQLCALDDVVAGMREGSSKAWSDVVNQMLDEVLNPDPMPTVCDYGVCDQPAVQVVEAGADRRGACDHHARWMAAERDRDTPVATVTPIPDPDCVWCRGTGHYSGRFIGHTTYTGPCLCVEVER